MTNLPASFGTPNPWDPSPDMLGDDIFDGWLSVPRVGELFDKPIQAVPEQPEKTSYHTSLQKQSHIRTEATRSSLDVPALHKSQPLNSTDSPDETPLRQRRGHTKSRLGCLSCKRRKVKCQEQRPSCVNCIKRGCPCRYPTAAKHLLEDGNVSQDIKLQQSPRQIVCLSDTPKTYTGDDLRLFHHFLVKAYPFFPLEFDSIWIQEVPMLSHQYDYLMHAILALSGSHLSVTTGDTKPTTALKYRQRAIHGLQEAFRRWPPKAEEAHVMLACCYLLAFQSGYLPDGFQDHIINLRGCALLTQTIISSGLEGMFSTEPNTKIGSVESALKNLPFFNQGLARKALHSLAKLSPLIRNGHAIEKALYAQIVECVRPLIVYPPPSQHHTPTPDQPSPNTATPHTLKTINFQLRSPIIPSELPVSYDDISHGSPIDIASIPPTQTHPDVFRSFDAIMSSLLILTTWPQDAIVHLFSPTNKLGTLFLLHFVITRFMVAPLWAPSRAMGAPIAVQVDSAQRMLEALKDDSDVKWSEYVEFPTMLLTTLRPFIERKRGFSFKDLYDIMANDSVTL